MLKLGFWNFKPIFLKIKFLLIAAVVVKLRLSARIDLAS